jgi:hypothetical protein
LERAAVVLQRYGITKDVMISRRAADRRSRLSQRERVVSGQRILQAQSDPFLGWVEL